MQARASLRIALVMLAVLSFSTSLVRAQSAAPGSRVPLYFEQNQGQTDSQVHFLARSRGYTAYLTSREAVLQYRKGKPGQKDSKEAVVHLKLAGSQNPTNIQGVGLLPGIVNYLIGNDPSKWHTHIPTYSEVDYQQVYPGIDLAYRSSGPQLEFDLRVAPGADPNQIQLAYSGASSMHMDARGDMILETAAGPATIYKPVVYQEVNDHRVLVAGDYRVLRNGQVSFKLGKYDHSRELVVDPTIGPSVVWGTYLGSGTGGDTFGPSGSAGGIAVEPTGQVFLTGSTYADNYPTTVGSTFPVNYDLNFVQAGFVTALNATGTSLIYSTYIAGNGASASTGVNLNGIAVDSSGNAFIAGYTDDNTFPVTKAFQSTFPTSRTIYAINAGVVVELNASGTPVYSSYLGCPDFVQINAIAIDSSDNAYVAGVTTVQGGSFTSSVFPSVGSPMWPSFTQSNIGAGFENAFVAKITPPTSGNAALSYTELIGNQTSTPSTTANSIAVDSAGHAYVTGTSNGNISSRGGTITTQHDMTNATRSLSEYQIQTYVVEFATNGQSAVYVDYIGGSAPSGTFSPQTSVAQIAVDSSGNAYVVGNTNATNFQTTAGAYQTSSRLASQSNNSVVLSDAYVTMIAAGGASFTYSTYLDGTLAHITTNAGNEGTPFVGGVAVGSSGQFWVAGVASTTDFPNIFPTTAGAGTALLNSFPGGSGGANVGFLTEFPAGGGTPTYSVFVGNGNEFIYALNGVATNGTDAWIMESETSTNLATAGTYNTSGSDNGDELILRIQDAPAGGGTSPTATALTNSVSGASTYGQNVTFTATVTSSGTPVTAGTVTFNDTTTSTVLATALALNASGQASVTTSVLAFGSHTISAVYNPDASHTTSTNTTSDTVSKASLTITASNTTMTYGQSPPTPTAGYSAFQNSETSASLTTLPTCVTTATTTTVAGADNGANTCSGAVDTNYSFTYVAGNVTVNKDNTTTAVTSSLNPSVFGQSVTLTATVSAVAPGSGTRTGTVTFLDGGVSIGTGTLSGGVATLATSALAVGNHTITTSYAGDGNFNTSTGSLTGNPQVVNKTNTNTAVTTSANPTVFGQSVTFTATISAVAPGAGTPTGTVTFLDGGSSIGTGTLTAGVATLTTSSLAVANHTITTGYGGDGNFNGSTGTMTGNPQVVNKANTTTAVTTSANPTVIGQSVTFTATVAAVAPGAGTRTGTVTFLDGGTSIGTGTLSGGVATLSTTALTAGNHTITASYGGDGNFNTNTGSLTGNPQVVNKANTTTAVVSSVNPSVYGQSITITATVTAVAPGAGTPTGSVNILDGGVSLGFATLTGGVATFTSAVAPVGSHTITTAYGGDPNFNTSTGSLTGNPQIINKANTTTGVTSSLNPTVSGQSVTFTATVSAVAPGAGSATGTVTFLDGGTSIGTGTLSGGVATLTTSALAVGNHTITTSYGGDTNFNGSTGTMTGNPQVVNKANTTTTVTTSANPSVYGQSITLTATISVTEPGGGVATGTVTFLDGGVSIGTGILTGEGTATLTTSALTVGNHTITTTYAGSANYNGSTGTMTGNPQVVNKANTTSAVTTSANPSSFGQSITFTATIAATAPGSGVATGSVTFLDGGVSIGTGTLNGEGTATLTTSALAIGNHTITTSYVGDGNFNASTGTMTGNPQVVSKANSTSAVTSSLNPLVFGQSVTFTATISAVAPGSGTATGTVTFLDGGVSIGTGTLSGGVATLTTSALGAGNHTITISYGGDGNFNGSTGSLTGNPEVVNKASSSTTVTSSPNPTVYGQSVTLTANVSVLEPGSGNPSGIVTFLANGVSIGTGTITDGVATLTTSSLPAGNNIITVSYAGDSSFNGGTASLATNPQVTSKANSSTTVTSSVNPTVFSQSVTFTATVAAVAPGSGIPTGTVTFLDGGVSIGTGNLTGEGTATFTTSSLAVGGHTITISYGGDGNFNGGTTALTGNPQVVSKASSTAGVIASVNPTVSGQTVTFTASIGAVAPATGPATGTVTFLDGGASIGTATVTDGVAVLMISNLAVGSHTITISYSGDTNFNASVASLEANPEVVNMGSTTTSVTSSQNPLVFGQPVTFTATVAVIAPATGTATGIVTFLDNGVSIGTGTLSGGVATFTTSSLGVGSHTITVSYPGDGNFNGGTGSVENNPQIIGQSSTTVTLTPSSASIMLGDTVTFTAAVAAGSGSGIPTGIVTFFDGTTPLGSATLSASGENAQASFATSLLFAIPHSIKAIYQGDSSFSPGTSTVVTEGVEERPTTTGVVMNPSTIFIGQVSTGTVTVTDGGTSTPPGTPEMFSATGAPAIGQTGFTATQFGNGLVLVAGGTNPVGTVVPNAEIYSVTGAAFTPTGNLNTARTGAVAVLLPTGKVLVAGGSSDGTAAGALNTAELFDPNAGTFSSSANPMLAPRLGATATLLSNGWVLLAGGQNGDGVTATAELYNPTTDTFVATGNLNTARTGASATPLGNGMVLVAGGSSDGTPAGALATAELFDPTANAGAGAFTNVDLAMSFARWQPQAALLFSGKVLIAGGQNSSGALTSADIYDPVANSFTASAQQMAQARANGSAIALPSGMVLLAGGATPASTVAELYDPIGDQFDVTGSLQTADTGLVLTLLNNGTVLGLGLNNNGDPAPDAEIFSPAFNPLGAIALTNSDEADIIPTSCTLAPSTGNTSTCTFTEEALQIGTNPHTITGTYSGDAIDLGSSNSAPVALNLANTTTTITSTANPSVYGQSVTFHADVEFVAPADGKAFGTVTFYDGGVALGTEDLGKGGADFTTSTLAVGNHTITTSYDGDDQANGSNGALTGQPQVVTQASSTIGVAVSPNPAVYGTSVTVTVNVTAVDPGTGTPTGTVTLLDGGVSIGTGTLSNGSYTFTLSSLSAGNHTLSVSYAGDTNFTSATATPEVNPLVVTKAATFTTVTSTTNPSVYGQAVTFTATVTNGDTPVTVGTVTFVDATTSATLATAVPLNASGQATVTLSTLTAGSHSINVVYNADPNRSNSTGTVTFVVGQAMLTVTAGSTMMSYGGTPPAVTPGYSGFVGTDTAASLTTPAACVTAATNTTPVGTDTAANTCSGAVDPNYSIAYVPGNVVVNKATLTITASTTTMIYGATPPAVTPMYSGFTGTDTAASLTTPPVCVTTLTSTTAGGTYTGANTCSGAVDANYTIVYVAGNGTVTKLVASVVLATSQSPIVLTSSVTFTATVSATAGTPTGTVSFFDGTTLLGSGTIASGMVTYTTSSLGVGPHFITAAYNGDGNFLPVTSTATSEVVQDFTLTLTASSGSGVNVTVLAGGTAVYNLQVGPTTGTTFPGPVTLTVSGLPPGATATIVPNTLPAGSGTTNVVLTVQLAKPSTVIPLRIKPLGPGMALALLSGLLLLPITIKLRRTPGLTARFAGVALLVFIAAGATLGLTSCGGTSTGYYIQQQQNYTITVTATSGSLSHSASVGLTVK